MGAICSCQVTAHPNALSTTGGSDAVQSLHKQNQLISLLEEKHNYDYDLVVIGGGSGGLSAAKVSTVLVSTVLVSAVLLLIWVG